MGLHACTICSQLELGSDIVTSGANAMCITGSLIVGYCAEFSNNYLIVTFQNVHFANV